MKTRAAVIWEPGQDWEVMDLELDPPKEREVLIRWRAAGLCHSDEHIRAGKGNPNTPYPMVGGHEGAGIVEAVGPGVERVKPGDHVVCAYIPSCGHCRWCSTGHQNLCDLGAFIGKGSLLDGTYRLHARGQDIATMCLLGTFSEYSVVPEYSCLKLDPDIPFEVAALVGCGVTTGWGGSVYAAGTRPGDTVAIFGIGGVGMSAVQGAKMAGARYIVAVDPLESKRRWAKEFGATHVAANGEEARKLIQEITWGAMADKAVVTAGEVYTDVVMEALSVVGKTGTVVIIGMMMQGSRIQIPQSMITLFEKRIFGSLFGNANPVHDIPHLLKLYRDGQFPIDRFITSRYTLDQVNQGYRDMWEGKNIRGIIEYPA
ncbi:MAG: NDMA-dependent alcohol dehydrogenase [Firmicutes bacterium]|nr:NDMA-dependent alcohol dehydrogenase [Alicyclobacillaceae bacterium]MCL6498301.1 NDMA-dependent alcohol dehydrogenase [Bacillota bacterium]